VDVGSGDCVFIEVGVFDVVPILGSVVESIEVSVDTGSEAIGREVGGVGDPKVQAIDARPSSITTPVKVLRFDALLTIACLPAYKV